MSTLSADGSSPSFTGKSPAIGSNTIGIQKKNASSRRLSVATIDVSGFSTANFQPEFCTSNNNLQYNMDDDTPESIQSIHRTLESARDKATLDLQRSVHRSFNEFVQISKELAGFEAQMNELHGIINQLNGLSETLLSNVPVCSESIVLDEEQDINVSGQTMVTPSLPAMDLVERRAKINRVLEHVSDLEDFLSESTNRWIVFEGTDISYLPMGNRSSHNIFLYLLNDSIIGTSKKPSRIPLASGSKKFQVEFCLLFSECSFEDANEHTGGQSIFGLKLMKNNQQLGTILFDSQANKKFWQDQLKKTIIQDKMQKSIAGARLNLQPVKERFVKKATRSGLASRISHRRGASSSAQRRAAELSAVTSATIADLPDEKYKKLLYMVDDLDQASTLRKYESATELVDQLTFNLEQLSSVHIDSPRLHTLKKLLDGKKRRLAEFLLAEISRLLIGKQEMVKYIQLLTVLGYADSAREKFLSARTELIRSQTKSLRYHGNIKNSVKELSTAIFSGIRITSEWYRAAFDESIRLSGLIFWIRLEIVDFCSVLSRLLFNCGMRFEDIGGCIQEARIQCISLQEIGLKFNVIFDNCFSKPIGDLLQDRISEMSETIADTINSDELTEFVALDDHQVPKSVSTCAELIQSFVNESLSLVNANLSNILAVQCGHLFEITVTGYVSRFYAPDSASTQNQALLTSTEYFADHLFTLVYDKLSNSFEQDFVSLRRTSLRLMSGIHAMYDILTVNSASNWMPESWSCYEEKDPLGEVVSISPWIMQFLPQMVRISKEAPSQRRPRLLNHLVMTIMKNIDKALPSISFKLGGLEQLMLDLYYLLTVFDSFMDDDAVFFIVQMNQTAIESSALTPTKPQAWFESKADVLYHSTSKSLVTFE